MCQYAFIDGTWVHINGDLSKMDKKALEAITAMVKLARNYAEMKKLEGGIPIKSELKCELPPATLDFPAS